MTRMRKPPGVWGPGQLPKNFQAGQPDSSKHNPNHADIQQLPVQVGVAARAAVLRASPHFVLLVTHLHSLGSRPTAELLLEVCRTNDLMIALERYARLDPDIVRQLGCDQFPRAGSQR